MRFDINVYFHKEKNVYTKRKEFQKANEERKIELIKTDAFNLMIQYLRGKIGYTEIQNKINELCKFGLLDKTALELFIKDRILYEVYQCSLGKSEQERKLIIERMMKFK